MFSEFPKIWGPTRAARITAWVFVGVGVCAAVVGIVAGAVQAVHGDVGALWVGIAYAGLFGVVFGVSGWRFGLVPRITAESEGVRVRNPSRETFIRWDHIVDAVPGFAGITIETSNGGAVTAWAVQKWRLSSWLGKRTRADEVADFIRNHATGSGQETC